MTISGWHVLHSSNHKIAVCIGLSLLRETSHLHFYVVFVDEVNFEK